jgi:transposase-like protein
MSIFDTRKSAYEVLTDTQLQKIAKDIVYTGKANCPLCNNPLQVSDLNLLMTMGYIRFNCLTCDYLFQR